MHYRDRNGIRRRESSGMEDWQEAQKCLRERLQTRDDNTLPAITPGASDYVWAMGGYLLGGLLQTALPRAEDSFCQRARAEAFENNV